MISWRSLHFTINSGTQDSYHPTQGQLETFGSPSWFREEAHHLSLLILRKTDIDRRTISPSVRRPTSHTVDDAGDDAEDREGQADVVARNVLWCVFCQERPDGDDAANVAEAWEKRISRCLRHSSHNTSTNMLTNLPRSTHRTPMMAPEILTEPAHDDGHGTVSPHGDEEECGIFQRPIVVDGNEDGEACYGYADAADRERGAFLRDVGECGCEHGESECRRPGGHRVQLCLDCTVAVGLDDACGM